jgi:hypothetical protein
MGGREGIVSRVVEWFEGGEGGELDVGELGGLWRAARWDWRASCWVFRRRYFWRVKACSGGLWRGLWLLDISGCLMLELVSGERWSSRGCL